MARGKECPAAACPPGFGSDPQINPGGIEKPVDGHGIGVASAVLEWLDWMVFEGFSNLNAPRFYGIAAISMRLIPHPHSHPPFPPHRPLWLCPSGPSGAPGHSVSRDRVGSDPRSAGIRWEQIPPQVCVSLLVPQLNLFPPPRPVGRRRFCAPSSLVLGFFHLAEHSPEGKI